MLLPEVLIAVGLLVILILGLFRIKNTFLVGVYVLILVVAIGTSFFLTEEAMFLPFRRLVLVSALASVLFFIYSPIFRSEHTSETLFLLLASVLGLNVMMLAEDLLSLFIALELAAIASYILVILSWKKQSTEGAIKYLLFGVFASAIMLYGISWVYGLSGSTDWQGVSWKIPISFWHYASIFMMLAGLLMKISAVPYHIWTPDVYQIAPTPVVAFLATASKIAGIVAMLKIIKAYEPVFPD
ncbi:MAG: proton-conducting transporter membrane subunit, partial [Raineya sp.]